MKFLPSLLIIGIILAGLFSCARYQEHRYEYVNKRELAGMKKLYLLGVDIRDTSSDDDNEVVFFTTAFVKDSFLDSFLSGFNQNNHGMHISLIEREKHQQFIEGYISNGITLGIYQNHPLPKKMWGRWIRQYHPDIAGDGYVTLEFETSVWKQNAVGFFKIYNAEGRVIWREQIRDFSPYIVFDSESPYLMKNKQIFTDPERRSYYDEVKRVYRVLGENLAKEFSTSL